MIVVMPAGVDGNPDPIVTPQRTQVLSRAAREILGRRIDGKPLLVGVDGIDGAGKSTFADEVAGVLVSHGVTVVRSTVDSFHNPKSVRWRRGRRSPFGFYLDSYDLDALRHHLLNPFLAGPGAIYLTAVLDEPSDQPVEVPDRTVTGDEILLFDGIFLCRPELARYWDFTIVLDGQARVNLTRLGYVIADAPDNGIDLVDHVLRWVERIDRYSSGMGFYLDSTNPRHRADLVIDNNHLARPSIIPP